MVRYYRELTRLEMEAVDKEETLVLIPVGALEQHGNQCPLGTDEIIAEATARRLKEALDREIPDYPMLIFPTIPVGLSTEHINFCGSVTLKPDTFYHVLADICRGIAHHGFRKIAVLNCHGGNSPIIQVLSRELRSGLGIAVFIINCGSFLGNQAVEATASAAASGQTAIQDSQYGTTRLICVCWLITSETSTPHGVVRPDRPGRSRAFSSHHAAR